MKFVKFGTLLAVTASALVLGACSPKPGDPAATGPAAATVNGKPISQRTIDMIVKQGGAAGHADSPEARKSIIDQLALQMVVAEEAVKKGLDKSPEVLDRISSLRQSVLANAYVEDFIKSNPISEDALKAEYERIKASISGTEYMARHILVDKESEAKDIIARLKKDPAQFPKLAMEKSKDQGSKARGGELGWFDPRRMVPEFSAAVAKLEKGKFTEVPVKSQFGYHVILLEDSRAIEAPPLEQVKAQLSQQLQQQGVKKQLDALKAAAKIEIVDAAPAAPAAPASK
jgi:peptidyl-prolyl cis-trans isomerase C